MGNAPGKPHTRPRNKKYLQIKGTDRPAPPGKPYLAPELDSTPDVLTIRWDTPHKNGGAPLSGYLVEHRRTGSPHWVRATPLMVRVPELTLSGLEPGWRYQFRVFAENLVGLSDASELSDPLTVTLQRSAVTAPRFTQELKDTVVLENEKVEFVVHFVGQPAPKMCWFKDGFEIFSSRRTRILTESDRSILTIHQSAICDEGEIKCTATNKAGHISTKARLTLEAPPSIRLPRQYEDGLLFEIGELIRFKVSVAGLPSPLIFWTHNGESINENERYEIENDDKTSTLRISEALRGDRGEYQIKAVNKLGSDIASFLVTVTDKPSPPGRAKVVMSLGRSVTLSWNTPDDDGGCKIGNYIVEYYRLGWNVWLKAATSRQLSTILGDLIEGSEYKFRIKAESPFGVSEPSEESDLVFIPDPKRGILEPTGSRSRSQPKEIIDPKAPVAAKRKKPRSHSSSRGEELEEDSLPGSPIRPERLKIKSPPKTPERLSPHVQRKEVNVTAINKALFDRSTMSREFSYGSPEIKIKRTDVPIPKEVAEVKPTPQKPANPQLKESIKNTIQVVERQKQKSPSPMKGRSPSPSRFQLTKDTIDVNTLKESSPGKKQTGSPGLSRDDSENLGGSTEFMMVLYPGENREMFNREFVFDLDNEEAVPPPLSLSAPELGSEPPVFETLRLSASSTELLHERAMVRFYQEALAEEEAIRRRRDRGDDERRSSLVPKIQINNKEENDIVGLERKHSLRRRLSAGGSVPQQVLLAQKRQSWRSSNEFSDLFDSKIPKTVLTVDEKRELMQNRQRSHSEEKEEEIFERVRKKMADLNPETTHKKKISVVEEEAWEPEYEESISEEESSEDERLADEPVIREITPEEEDQTYHPRMVFPAVDSKSKYEEPFEILTKPAKLPDANFIPKPILKKKDNGNTKQQEINEAESQLKATLEEVYHQPISKFITKRGSIPDIPLEEEFVAKHDTGTVARMAGMTAAVVAIPQQLLDKKEAEESKVVIEHYGDILKTRGHKQQSQLENNPIREALRKAAALQAALHHSDDEEEEITTNNNNNRSNDFNERFKTLERKLDTPPPPRSLTPIFKQVKVAPVSDDIFEKIKEVSPPKIMQAPKSSTEQSKSPPKETPQQPEAVRGRETSRYTKRNVAQSKSPHKEPRKTRKASPSPVVKAESRSGSTAKKKTPQQSRSNSTTRNQSRSNSITRPPSRSASKQRSRRSPSPQPMLLRKPKMCEIMTQTSTSMDTYEPSTSKQITSFDNSLLTNAQLKVRTTMDYTTDLAMFAVAFWVFLFSNELFALPVLLVAVYRQLKDEMKRWVPKWIKKRWNRPRKE